VSTQASRSHAAEEAAAAGAALDVAVLVAEGLTNREIGVRLHLSEKTIVTHLTSVFRKLGARSRAQVAAAVAGAGEWRD
jgi:DNA-binding NarL/FixJ family response regulator